MLTLLGVLVVLFVPNQNQQAFRIDGVTTPDFTLLFKRITVYQGSVEIHYNSTADDRGTLFFGNEGGHRKCNNLACLARTQDVRIHRVIRYRLTARVRNIRQCFGIWEEVEPVAQWASQPCNRAPSIIEGQRQKVETVSSRGACIGTSDTNMWKSFDGYVLHDYPSALAVYHGLRGFFIGFGLPHYSTGLGLGSGGLSPYGAEGQYADYRGGDGSDYEKPVKHQRKPIDPRPLRDWLYNHVRDGEDFNAFLFVFGFYILCYGFGVWGGVLVCLGRRRLGWPLLIVALACFATAIGSGALLLLST